MIEARWRAGAVRPWIYIYILYTYSFSCFIRNVDPRSALLDTAFETPLAKPSLPGPAADMATVVKGAANNTTEIPKKIIPGRTEIQ